MAKKTIKKSTSAATTRPKKSGTKAIADAATVKTVEVKVKKLTSQDIEDAIDKIITKNTKDKPIVKAKYRPPKKVDASVKQTTEPVFVDKKAAKLNKRAAELKLESSKKVAALKLEAEERIAKLRSEAEERAAQIKIEADEKAAELKMKANEKAARLTLGVNRKAVKRELKETIRRAKQEAAEKLGRTVKKKPVKKVIARADRSEPVRKKASLPRTLVKLSLGTFAVMLLCVGAGAVYTWYMGQNNSPLVADVAPVASASAPVVAPRKPSADAKVGVSLQSITPSVKPGSSATLQVKTNPDAVCTIKAVYNNVASKDSSLVTKTADVYGDASWSWTVDSSAPAGKWPITVTCSSPKNSGMFIADLVVTK